MKDAVLTIENPLDRFDAAAVAVLHQESIPAGFLSSLPVSFLLELYRSIAANRHGVVILAKDEECGTVIGFLAGTSDVKRMYKDIIVRKWPLFLRALLPRLVSFKTLKKIFETVTYPVFGKKQRIHSTSTVGSQAELLSIAIHPSQRNRGIGRQLIKEFESGLSASGVNSYSVVTDSKDASSNMFYKSCGFLYKHTIQLHENILTTYEKTIQPLDKESSQ